MLQVVQDKFPVQSPQLEGQQLFPEYPVAQLWHEVGLVQDVQASGQFWHHPLIRYFPLTQESQLAMLEQVAHWPLQAWQLPELLKKPPLHAVHQEEFLHSEHPAGHGSHCITAKSK